jgi:hypothetical protein
MVMVAGCKGGGSDLDQPGNFFTPDAIQQANESRLEPAANLESAVSGSLSITGFTVLDEMGQPGLDTNGAPKAAARLLDPGDDILSQVMPGVDGRFMLSTTEPVSAGIVEIEFRVQEDIDGDGEGDDTIISRIPVALEPGRTATLDLELSKGLAAGVDSELALAPQDGSGGEYMVTRYEALDASGLHESFYGTFFGSASVIYDVDRDEFLEAGDDISLADDNTNGWADAPESQYGSAGAVAFIQGVISGVNTAKQQFTLRFDDGTTATVNVLPFAGFEVLGEDGLFVGSTSLGLHLVGMEAVVEGLQEPGGTFAATWVVVQN